MPSTLLRLAVALLTFGVGVGATILWVAYRTPEVHGLMPESGISCTKLLGPQAILLGPQAILLGPQAITNDYDVPPPPPPPKPVRAPISGGILNGKAIRKPAPAYPPMAKAYLVSGMVNVQVTLNESGRVIAAEAVSGHPLLQEAAVEAARQAWFSPTLFAGQPVKVSGTITYNFVLR